ncbi:carbohydrate kinase family protein [Lutimonas sp.]|uniref:carbohydrate kinase family protein n=1 Tax=Lutimonas sp. TaxID=1872403 RepID=UPI003C76A7CB
MIPEIVCFGETLWDIFPDKKIIGGAPLNVGLRLHSLGAEVKVISRIGKDADGNSLLNYLREEGMDLGSIQLDPELTTGNVQVHLDQNHTATYTISEPVAWDRIAVEQSDIGIISKTDAFIFGSLCCRNSISKNTLFQYLSQAKFKVFDANLRPPFYTMELVFQLMKIADMIKLNDEELDEMVKFLRIESKSIEDQIKNLSELTHTQHICVTLGAKGAICFTHGEFFKNTGYKVVVKDTVGAGDSFLASLVYQFVMGVPSQQALDFSCAMGSLVASKNGANADVSIQEIKKLQDSNKL